METIIQVMELVYYEECSFSLKQSIHGVPGEIGKLETKTIMYQGFMPNVIVDILYYCNCARF